MTNKEIQKEIDKLQSQINKLEKQKIVPKSKKKFTCQNKNCGIISTLGKCDFVDYLAYHDCPYTPDWRYSESGVICPHCKFKHRLLTQPNKDKFGAEYLWIEEVYKRHIKEYDNIPNTFTLVCYDKEDEFGSPKEIDITKPYTNFINI